MDSFESRMDDSQTEHSEADLSDPFKKLRQATLEQRAILYVRRLEANRLETKRN